MNGSIIEKYRKLTVSNLFEVNSFNTAWETWKDNVNSLIPNKNVTEITDLGSSLKDIFYSTNDGRTQATVSAGGTVWENLVCWYLNLCSVGSRTVVTRPIVALLPAVIRDAIAVKYGTFVSNTEADLVAITFPETYDDNFNNIANENQIVHSVNDLLSQHFNEIEINIIQCKTNWNDNAQIPMLWDMIYKVRSFEENNIRVGQNNYSIKNCRRFTYSFATVPTVALSRFKTNSVAVKRVSNLSGGVFWGNPSRTGVALSLSELPAIVFFQNQNYNMRRDLAPLMAHYDDNLTYFNLN